MIKSRLFYSIIFVALTFNVVAAPPGFEDVPPDPLPQSGGGGGTSVPIDD